MQDTWNRMKANINRRSFMQKGAAAGVATVAALLVTTQPLTSSAAAQIAPNQTNGLATIG